jgi:hypothetical protein
MDANLKANIAGEEDATMGKMRRFCASILKKLAPPILREIESSNALRVLEPETPRRVTRATGSSAAAAVAPRRSKKASAAETVLLKALGITPTELEVDDAALQEFRDLFDSPVRDQHLRAMAAIFGKTMPSSLEAKEMGSGGIVVL